MMFKVLLSALFLEFLALPLLASDSLTKNRDSFTRSTVSEILDSLVNDAYFKKDTNLNPRPEQEKPSKSKREKKEYKTIKKKVNKAKILAEIPSDTPPVITTLIRSNKVTIGMSTKHVILSWGKPRNINRSIGKWGVHEQWVYPNRYLYFENGILTSLQTSD